ncbi:MAG: sugar ABC transporter substrate-binding protein [Chloroflexota bacterium]
MSFRRRVGPLALVAAALIPAGALAASPAPAASPATSAATDSVSFMIFGDPAELAAYHTLVDAFEAARPGIDVQLIEVPDQGDYRQRLGADLAAGTPADVVLVNYRNMAPLAAAGQLQPLTDRLRTSTVIQDGDLYPQAADAFRWRGEQMCIPQNISSLAVYYNQDLFDAAGLPYPTAGWTWDDFVATATALTKDLDGDGVTDQYGLGTQPELIRLAPFLWQAGAEVVNNPKEPTGLDLHTANGRKALDWFVGLQTVHHVVPDRVAEEAEDSESRFLGGRTAMYLNSRRGVPTYREAPFRWDVAPLPVGEEAATVLHSDGFCMPAASTHQDAAWSLIEYANSPEGQTVIAGTGRTVPSLKSVATSPAFLDPTKAPASSQVWLDAIPTIHALPTLQGWPDIEEQADEALAQAFYGELSVDDAIAEIDSRTAPFFKVGGEG